jgi:hypothetical protein
MRSLFLLTLVALFLAVPNQASANSCSAYVPFATVRPMIPVGCPLVIYTPAEYGAPETTFDLTRDGMPVGTFEAPSTRSDVNLDVYFETIDDDCVEHNYTEARPYWRYAVDISSLAPGTVVRNYLTQITVTEAGACPAEEFPYLYCQDGVQDYWACQDHDMPIDPDDNTSGGCHTSGNSCGGAAALLVLFVVGRRRRR